MNNAASHFEIRKSFVGSYRGWRNLLKSLFLACCFTCFSLAVSASDISSFAFINQDGSLRISNQTIYLFGIYIPADAGAAAALNFKIGSAFVHCDVKEKRQDGSLVAVCRVDGDDLAAYLLQRGKAAVLPEAPPEYEIMERIARSRRLGIWAGIPAEDGGIYICPPQCVVCPQGPMICPPYCTKITAPCYP